MRGVLLLAGPARRELERGGGARAGRLLGRSIGLGFAAALAVLAFAGARDVLQQVVVAALGWLTWIAGGLVALAAARAPRDEDSALAALARFRGHPDSALAPARALATTRSIAAAIAWPAALLALGAVLLARTFAEAALRVLLLGGVLAYAGLCAVVLGVLSSFTALFGGARGRTLFVLVILVPQLARSLLPGVPSLPALLESARAWLATLGAAA